MNFMGRWILCCLYVVIIHLGKRSRVKLARSFYCGELVQDIVLKIKRMLVVEVTVSFIKEIQNFGLKMENVK